MKIVSTLSPNTDDKNASYDVLWRVDNLTTYKRKVHYKITLTLMCKCVITVSVGISKVFCITYQLFHVCEAITGLFYSACVFAWKMFNSQIQSAKYEMY